MEYKLSSVHPDAKIGQNVEIGPFVTIDKDVVIGDGTKIMSGAVIFEGTRIGKNCRIFPHAVLGAFYGNSIVLKYIFPFSNANVAVV